MDKVNQIYQTVKEVKNNCRLIANSAKDYQEYKSALNKISTETKGMDWQEINIDGNVHIKKIKEYYLLYSLYGTAQLYKA